MRIYWLLVMVPVSLALDWFEAAPWLVFLTSALSIVPLASLMERATESLAHVLGPNLGGLLSASLGNAPEMIIAISALFKGLDEIVKASIVGSILGNLLFVLGVAMIAGGAGRSVQLFNRESASLGSGLLFLAVSALMVPALFFHSTSDPTPEISSDPTREISVEIAAILFLVYGLSLLFSLKTHKHLLGERTPDETGHTDSLWSVRVASAVLVGVTVVIAVVSHVLTGSVEATAKMMGLSDVFAGVILLATVGNLAQLINSVRFARKDKMDLALSITVGSSTQIALLVAPLLVFVGFVSGQRMDLVFTEFEVIGLAITILAVRNLTHDGESHWMEGVMLVAIYLILAIGLYFLPVPVTAS